MPFNAPYPRHGFNDAASVMPCLACRRSMASKRRIARVAVRKLPVGAIGHSPV
ncbi:Inner membrane protein yebS [Yersinia frederiksenii ATCC 33641]|nr:Inner membrane protein yebS [Yersinia frederiksenii ATCC 33641]